MAAGGSGSNSGIVSPTAAGDAFARIVRAHCLARRRLTIAELGRESGLGEERLRKLIANDPLDRKRVRLDEALSVLAMLGPDAATTLLGLIGMAALDAEAADAAPGHGVAAILAATATIATAAADGRIDHSEAAACRDAAERIIPAAAAFRGPTVVILDDGE